MGKRFPNYETDVFFFWLKMPKVTVFGPFLRTAGEAFFSLETVVSSVKFLCSSGAGILIRSFRDRMLFSLKGLSLGPTFVLRASQPPVQSSNQVKNLNCKNTFLDTLGNQNSLFSENQPFLAE